MKKVLYLLLAVVAMTLTACSGSDSVEKLVEKPADEITVDEVKTMADYVGKLVDSAEGSINSCQNGSTEDLQKWADAHRSEIELAGKVFMKFDELPAEKLEGTKAREVSQKFLGLTLLMSMVGVK